MFSWILLLQVQVKSQVVNGKGLSQISSLQSQTKGKSQVFCLKSKFLSFWCTCPRLKVSKFLKGKVRVKCQIFCPKSKRNLTSIPKIQIKSQFVLLESSQVFCPIFSDDKITEHHLKNSDKSFFCQIWELIKARIYFAWKNVCFENDANIWSSLCLSFSHFLRNTT